MKNETHLANVEKVVFNDFTEYDGCYDENGYYSHWTTYSRIDDDHWQRSYHTNGNIERCPVCGEKDDHYNDITGTYICGEPEVITSHELYKRMFEFEWNATDYEWIVLHDKKETE